MKRDSRGSRVLDSGLLWFFTELDGDLGRRAVSLEPQARGHRDIEPSKRQLDAARNARVIEAALRALSHADQRTLRDAHTPLLPVIRRDLAPLGDMAGVIVRNPATDAAALAVALKTTRQGARGDRTARDAAEALIASLRTEAAVRVASALGAYRSAKRAQSRAAGEARRARIAARERERFDRRWTEEQTRVFGHTPNAPKRAS